MTPSHFQDASVADPNAPATWDVWDDRETGSLAARIGTDVALLREVQEGARLPTARIWQPARGIAVTRAEARLPGFDGACASSAASGWPVVVRESGGGAVPHDVGVLCLSLLFEPPPRLSLEEAYAWLCEPLVIALESFQVPVSTGAVPGAFCDGRFNLTASGRKIIGTAQRWRARPGRGGHGAVLAHASWLVDLDLPDATAALNRFQAAAGSDTRFAPDACTTLRAELARRGDARAHVPTEILVGIAREALFEALGRGAPPLLASERMDGTSESSDPCGA